MKMVGEFSLKFHADENYIQFSVLNSHNVGFILFIKHNFFAPKFGFDVANVTFSAFKPYLKYIL